MKKQTMTLKNAAEAYLQYLQDQGKSPRTLYTYGQDLKQIQKFFGAERELSSILKQHVGKFLKSNDLLLLSDGSPRAQQTISKTFRVMRMLFQWAQAKNWLENIPVPQNATVKAAGIEVQ